MAKSAPECKRPGSVPVGLSEGVRVRDSSWKVVGVLAYNEGLWQIVTEVSHIVMFFHVIGLSCQ